MNLEATLPAPHQSVRERTMRWVLLVVVVLLLGGVWLMVLPAIGSQPAVAQHIATQQRLGIDPSAMFYTELDIADGLTRSTERLRDQNPAWFWNVPASDSDRSR